MKINKINTNSKKWVYTSYSELNLEIAFPLFENRQYSELKLIYERLTSLQYSNLNGFLGAFYHFIQKERLFQRIYRIARNEPEISHKILNAYYTPDIHKINNKYMYDSFITSKIIYNSWSLKFNENNIIVLCIVFKVNHLFFQLYKKIPQAVIFYERMFSTLCLLNLFREEVYDNGNIPLVQHLLNDPLKEFNFMELLIEISKNCLKTEKSYHKNFTYFQKRYLEGRMHMTNLIYKFNFGNQKQNIFVLKLYLQRNKKG